jgi:hypothetical protein
LTVTFTGARTLPNAGFGSNGTGMKHVEPSRKIVALNVLFIGFLAPGTSRPGTSRVLMPPPQRTLPVTRRNETDPIVGMDG